MTSVEQIKGKRAGVGLRAHDPERAFPGFTLFAPLTGGGHVYLIDMQGEIAHTWSLPYSPGLYGYLTPRGTLLYNGKVPEESERFIADKGWKGGAMLEAELGRRNPLGATPARPSSRWDPAAQRQRPLPLLEGGA